MRTFHDEKPKPEPEYRFHAFVWKNKGWRKIGEYKTQVDALTACYNSIGAVEPRLNRVIKMRYFPKIKDLLS